MERSQVDLRVDEGRVDVSVPEQVGDRLQRLPVLEHSRGEAVAEYMRACSGRVHTRFTHALGDHARKRGGLQRAERRLSGQEDFGVRDLRAWHRYSNKLSPTGSVRGSTISLPPLAAGTRNRFWFHWMS